MIMLSRKSEEAVGRDTVPEIWLMPPELRDVGA